MNTKRFLTMLLLLLVVAPGIAAPFMMRNPVTAEGQSQKFVSVSLTLLNEPASRMWSGPIQFNDGNSPDFKPHLRASADKFAVPSCMADEQVTPRRWGGCIQ